LAGEDERISLLSNMEKRFGISSSIFEHCLLFNHRNTWWLLKKPPSLPAPGRLKVEMVGLKAFQKVGSYIKPTTRLVQIFGCLATRAKLDLTEQQLEGLVGDGAFELPDIELEDGYVILCLGDYTLGLGLLIQGKVRSLLPHRDLRFFKNEPSKSG
jgi:NOL1/NOP2/fmu family ribosome biogenesis protein